MTVYVDVLLIVNLYVNYLLLLCTTKLLVVKPRQFRIILSAITGSVYGLIIFLPQLPNILSFLIKIFVSIIMIIICLGFKNLRRFIRQFLTFCAVSFSFAGIMYLLWTAVAPVGMYFSNGIAYFDIDLKTLVISTIACFIIISIINFFISKKAPRSSIYTIEIIRGNKKLELTALSDTGNSLRESFSGFPVIIAQYNTVKSVVPKGITEYIKNGITNETDIRFVIHNTISGSGLSPAFKPDCIKLKSLSKTFTITDVYIAVVDKNIGNGEYQIILNPSVFEEAEVSEKIAQYN